MSERGGCPWQLGVWCLAQGHLGSAQEVTSISPATSSHSVLGPCGEPKPSPYRLSYCRPPKKVRPTLITPLWYRMLTPVLVDDIYDGHQLAGMGSEREVGNTADLNEAFEHLRKTPERVSHQKWVKLNRRAGCLETWKVENSAALAY